MTPTEDQIEAARTKVRNMLHAADRLDRNALVEIIMRETTDLITADGLPTGRPNVLVQGCRYIRGHARGYEDPEAAALGFAGFIADAVLAALSLAQPYEAVEAAQPAGDA